MIADQSVPEISFFVAVMYNHVSAVQIKLFPNCNDINISTTLYCKATMFLNKRQNQNFVSMLCGIRFLEKCLMISLFCIISDFWSSTQ